MRWSSGFAARSPLYSLGLRSSEAHRCSFEGCNQLSVRRRAGSPPPARQRRKSSDLPRPPSASGDGERYVLGLLQQRAHGHKARLRPGPAVQQGRVTNVRKELDPREAPYLEETFAWTSTPSEADSPTSYPAFSTNTSILTLLIFYFFVTLLINN